MSCAGRPAHSSWRRYQPIRRKWPLCCRLLQRQQAAKPCAVPSAKRICSFAVRTRTSAVQARVRGRRHSHSAASGTARGCCAASAHGARASAYRSKANFAPRHPAMRHSGAVLHVWHLRGAQSCAHHACRAACAEPCKAGSCGLLRARHIPPLSAAVPRWCAICGLWTLIITVDGSLAGADVLFACGLRL